MASRFACIFFDIDDTLFDRKGAQVEAACLIAKQLPETFGALDRARVTAAFLESDRISTERFDFSASPWAFRVQRSKLFLDLLGLATDVAEKVARIYVAMYPQVDAPVPHGKEVVRELRKRFKLGVISNGLPDIQHKKLAALGMAEAFCCVALSKDVGIEKPDPAIFHWACEAVSVAPAECLHVGDAWEADVQGALGAGLAACWYNPEGEAPPAGEAAPGTVIRDLRELLKTAA